MSHSASPTPLLLEATRHAEFYFPDGNICLVAGNTVFKLLRSQLAKESGIFKDLFSIGEGDAKDQETYDQVPLVRLDDDPTDLAALFTFLWSPPFIETSFQDICALTRVSNKYELDDVAAWCLLRLKTIIPCDIDGAPTTLKYYASHPGRAVTIINLARKCDLPQFLPLAWYYLTVTDTKDPTLDAQDLRRIIAARARLTELWWMFAAQSNDIGARSKCLQPEKVADQPLTMVWLQKGLRDPLVYLLNRETLNTKCCNVCKQAHLEECQAHAVRIFDQLAFMYDVSPKTPFKFVAAHDGGTERRRIKKLPRSQADIANGVGSD